MNIFDEIDRATLDWKLAHPEINAAARPNHVLSGEPGQVESAAPINVARDRKYGGNPGLDTDAPNEPVSAAPTFSSLALEDREKMIADWEKRGLLDPNCPGCREFYESPKLPCDVFAPSHKASGGCESGKRPHCTCDTCF